VRTCDQHLNLWVLVALGLGPFGLLTIARYQMLIWPRSGLENGGMLALQGSPLSVAVSVAAAPSGEVNQGLAFILRNCEAEKEPDCEGQEDGASVSPGFRIPATVVEVPGGWCLPFRVRTLLTVLCSAEAI